MLIFNAEVLGVFPAREIRSNRSHPPCIEYSKAKTIGITELEGAKLLVKKAFEIIAYFNPKFWWVENTRSGLLKEREVVSGFQFLDIDYCQFSEWGYKKPTRFWACKIISDRPAVLCDPRKCPNVHRRWDGKRKHYHLLGGPGQRISSTKKKRIPPAVIDYLLGVSERPKNRRANVWK